jgi:hypothetical protein
LFTLGSSRVASVVDEVGCFFFFSCPRSGGASNSLVLGRIRQLVPQGPGMVRRTISRDDRSMRLDRSCVEVSQVSEPRSRNRKEDGGSPGRGIVRYQVLPFPHLGSNDPLLQPSIYRFISRSGSPHVVRPYGSPRSGLYLLYSTKPMSMSMGIGIMVRYGISSAGPGRRAKSKGEAGSGLEVRLWTFGRDTRAAWLT